jgi:transposase
VDAMLQTIPPLAVYLVVGAITDRHTMTSSTIIAVNHNEPMDPPHPRADGPRRRRAFTASDKIAHLHAYEQACEHGEGGAYLRRAGLYSSLISEWRKQRDAGVLAGKRPGEKVGRLTAEQAEIARLTRELARANKRLYTTEAALDIMGKAHALLESLSERADSDEQRKKR